MKDAFNPAGASRTAPATVDHTPEEPEVVQLWCGGHRRCVRCKVEEESQEGQKKLSMIFFIRKRIKRNLLAKIARRTYRPNLLARLPPDARLNMCYKGEIY